jgi:hypothetical protein
MSQAEFEVLLADASKTIGDDLHWYEDDEHSPSVYIRSDILSDPGYPLLMRGSYNQAAKTLTFVLIHRAVGCIYRLDIGKEHHNPTCMLVGETHKHRWTEQYRDKEAYVPADITAPATNPVDVWKQFCREASITHNGIMHPPPAPQSELF